MKLLSTVTLIIVLILAGCNNESQYVHNDALKLNNIALGLAYVPDSNDDLRESTLNHIETLQINHVRMNQSWAFREPIRGDYYFEPLAERLDFYEDNNVEVLITIDIKALPDWSLELDEDMFLERFQQFIHKLVHEYGEQIHILQFGNEYDWEIDKYLNGDTELFVKMNNIIYEEVEAFSKQNERAPIVALSSISIGGLRSLAYLSGEVDNIYFEDKPFYSEDELASFQNAMNATKIKTEWLLEQCKYDLVDLHFYDEYWQWSSYMDVYYAMLQDLNKEGSKIKFIASEFGGPEPTMEPLEDSHRAKQLVNYIYTLDAMNIEIAYYFKLHEAYDKDSVYHPFSYLIGTDGQTTETYEVFRVIANSID